MHTSRPLPRRNKTVRWTLHLRNLSNNRKDMLCIGTQENNIYVQEFNDLFLTTVDVLDMAVMKYADASVPLLQQQEYKHAKMHREGIIDRLGSAADIPLRYKVSAKAFKLLLLGLGPHIGRCIALGAEAAGAATSHAFDQGTFFNGDVPLSNLVLFHLFEEVEHGMLTMQALKKDTYFILRLLLLPLQIMLSAGFFLGAPVYKLLGDPAIIYRQPLVVIRDLVPFCGTFLPAFIVNLHTLLVLYLNPFSKPSYPALCKQHDHFKKRIEKRNIHRALTSHLA